MDRSSPPPLISLLCGRLFGCVRKLRPEARGDPWLRHLHARSRWRPRLPDDHRPQFRAGRRFSAAAWSTDGRKAQASAQRARQETGRGGLPKDDREAARLYRLAADQGNASDCRSGCEAAFGRFRGRQVAREHSGRRLVPHGRAAADLGSAADRVPRRVRSCDAGRASCLARARHVWRARKARWCPRRFPARSDSALRSSPIARSAAIGSRAWTTSATAVSSAFFASAAVSTTVRRMLFAWKKFHKSEAWMLRFTARSGRSCPAPRRTQGTTPSRR
jgi:hypothetical protein